MNQLPKILTLIVINITDKNSIEARDQSDNEIDDENSNQSDNEIMEENNHQSDNEENNHQNDNEENRNQYPVNTSTGVIRFSERRNKGIPPDRYRCPVVIEESQEPKNFKEIDLRSDKQEWLKAIENEMKSLHDNDTWTLVETPKNRKIINSK